MDDDIDLIIRLRQDIRALKEKNMRGAKIIDTLLLLYEFWPEKESKMTEDNSMTRAALNYVVEIMSNNPDFSISAPLANCLREKGLIK